MAEEKDKKCTTGGARVLIALCGDIGAGKGTVREILEENFDFHGFSVVEPIIKAARGVFGNLDLDYFEDRELKETPTPRMFGKSPRDIMRTLGTEWGRELIHKNIWVELLLREISRTRHEHTILESDQFLAVVDSIRFDNEYELLKKYAEENDMVFEAWRVIRPGNPYIDKMSGHASDKGLSGNLETVGVGNVGSLLNLKLEVAEVLRRTLNMNYDEY